MECADPKNIGAWLPILRSYAPGLIAQCVHSRQLAEELVARWLETYMLADHATPAEAAKGAAEWFASFSSFKSHARPVTREQARAQSIKVFDLEKDKDLQDMVLSCHHAMRLTLTGSGAVKIIENSETAFINSVGMVMMGGMPGAPVNPNPLGAPIRPGLAPGPQNREQRRGQDRKKR